MKTPKINASMANKKLDEAITKMRECAAEVTDLVGFDATLLMFQTVTKALTQNADWIKGDKL